MSKSTFSDEQFFTIKIFVCGLFDELCLYIFYDQRRHFAWGVRPFKSPLNCCSGPYQKAIEIFENLHLDNGISVAFYWAKL